MGLEFLWPVVRSHSVVESSVCFVHEILEPASHSIVSKLYNGIGILLAVRSHSVVESSLCLVHEILEPASHSIVSKLYNGIGIFVAVRSPSVIK
eukprot:scaffold273108_cov24-Attheya_sp.AAC.1